jgi:hypothetical protein
MLNQHEMSEVVAGRKGGAFRPGILAIQQNHECGVIKIGPGGPMLPTYAWLVTTPHARHVTTIGRKLDAFEVAERIARKSCDEICVEQLAGFIGMAAPEIVARGTTLTLDPERPIRPRPARIPNTA